MSTTAEVEADLIAVIRRIKRAWSAPLVPIRAVKPSSGGTGGRTGGEGLPVPPALSDARTAVQACVYGWARVLIEDRDLQHARVRDIDVAPMCVLLERHARWMSGHEAVETMLEELLEAAALIESVTPPTRPLSERRPGEHVCADRRITLGDCALIITGRHNEDGRTWNVVDVEEHGYLGPQCSGRVTARLDDWGGADGKCRSCGTTADVDWWREDRIALEAELPVWRMLEVLEVEGIRTTEKALRRLIERDVLPVRRDSRGRIQLRREETVEFLRRRCNEPVSA